MARDRSLVSGIPESGFFDDAGSPEDSPVGTDTPGTDTPGTASEGPVPEAASAEAQASSGPGKDPSGLGDERSPGDASARGPAASPAAEVASTSSSNDVEAASTLTGASSQQGSKDAAGMLTAAHVFPGAAAGAAAAAAAGGAGRGAAALPTPGEGEEEGEEKGSSRTVPDEESEATSAPLADADGAGVSSSSRSQTRAETEGGQAVFAVENVAVHPSAAASQRIRGRLRLVKHDPAVYLSWTPYSVAERPQASEAQAGEKAQQYAIRAVSLSEIRSIRKQTPTLGWQYAIIVLNTGLAFPPLYFYDGGVRAFIAAVKDHATLIKSQDDPNVYLVNDTEDPLMIQRSLGSLRLQGAYATLSGSIKERDTAAAAAAAAAAAPGMQGGGGEDAARDVPMKVLTGFAGLTRFARIALGAARSRQGERVLGGADAAERMPVREATRDVADAAPAPAEGASDFEIVDPLEQVLNATRPPKKERQPPLSHEEWVLCLDDAGRVRDKEGLCARVFQRGLDPELRREVWKFLLGYYQFESTCEERRQLDQEKRKEYEIYKTQWQSVTPAQAKRFAKYRERVSRVEKDVVRTDRKLPQFAEDDSPSFTVLRSILMTYSFYNFDLGYCQGMSDLLSPFVVLMGEEHEAFWCFAQFMETMGRNFNRDQTGMHSQLLSLQKLLRVLDEPLCQYLDSIDAGNLFCCFRWLLILFKREFEFEDVLKLWERLWTCPMTKHFHLYLCCAILRKFRRNIFDEQMQFDALLRFVNELSCRLDLDSMLEDAEALCLWAGRKGEACVPMPVEEEAVLIEGPETGD